jgi:hypothetical protein
MLNEFAGKESAECSSHANRGGEAPLDEVEAARPSGTVGYN